jgi:D-cysteine desulfhydrase family pyridoxal phosphate-dependent enzyme
MTEFKLNSIRKINLCTLPTPIVHMDRLSNHLGIKNLFVKRDDLTGIAFGGNKNRKLEYLLADALNQKADVVITEGAVTSNHCRQTAGCSARAGLDCVLVLSDAHIDEEVNGNLLLDHILDTTIHRVKSSENRKPKMKEIADQLKLEGRNPYIIPTGGSNKIGVLGYVNFVKEIAEQSKQLGIKFDYFVHATGSAGTQAGLLIGKELYYPELEIIAMTVGDGKEFIINEIKHIISEFEQEFSIKLSIDDSDIIIYDQYFGEGYGIPNQDLINTVKLVAKMEGIFLDPVYNGKAMVGMIDLISKNIFTKDSKILFLHSGGGPAIFTYKDFFKKQ